MSYICPTKGRLWQIITGQFYPKLTSSVPHASAIFSCENTQGMRRISCLHAQPAAPCGHWSRAVIKWSWAASESLLSLPPSHTSCKDTTLQIYSLQMWYILTNCSIMCELYNYIYMCVCVLKNWNSTCLHLPDQCLFIWQIQMHHSRLCHSISIILYSWYT